jgi:hypothetical protein
MPANAWNHLVVAAIPTDEGLRCELRRGRMLAFGPEWRGQISVTDRLYVAEDVTVADRSTPLYVERGGRLDLAQIPITAAAPPKRDRRGHGFDATAAQHGISKVLATAAQIRDYFFAPERSAQWTRQPSWFEVLRVRKNSTPAEIRLAYRVRLLELKTNGSESNRALHAQLARGLQLLLDRELRRQYLLLLEDPDTSVAFPPWTVGSLRALGQKKGDLFLGRAILSASSHAPKNEMCGFPYDDFDSKDPRSSTAMHANAFSFTSIPLCCRCGGPTSGTRGRTWRSARLA